MGLWNSLRDSLWSYSGQKRAVPHPGQSTSAAMARSSLQKGEHDLSDQVGMVYPATY